MDVIDMARLERLVNYGHQIEHYVPARIEGVELLGGGADVIVISVVGHDTEDDDEPLKKVHVRVPVEKREDLDG